MSAPSSGASPNASAAAADLKGTYNPRKRGRTACTRCKHRKQKCDDQWPTCSNCRKAGTECDKSAVSEDEPPAAYTHALEQRIALLEARLSEQTHQRGPEAPPQTPNSGIRTQSRNNVLAEAVELLALGNIEAPAYVGASSGLNLALTLGEMVQATVWNKALPLDANGSRLGTTDGIGVPGGARAINRQEMVARTAEPPTDEHGTTLINTYLNQPQTRYPFLDEKEVWDLHGKRVTLHETPVQQLTKPERFGLFKLYMVYAIGAMLIQLTERNTATPPENYYMTALQHLFTARESKTTQNVEAMLLLVLYHVRSSSYGIWYMIGLAMRTCIDLGLHTRRHEVSLDRYTIQMRRRLFWSVYSLERTIAICLGRPLSIPDRQIDVDLPLDPEDEVWDETTPAQMVSPARRRSLSLAIWLFKMRRIESRIQFSIYRADKPLSALTPKMNQLYQDLESWKTSLVERFSDVDLNYPMCHYHRAVRLLIQPFLPLLPPSDPYYLICLRAAGGVCQAHKKLHQSLEYGHSFIAVQTVFVAGITLLYGLWTQQHAIWSYSLSNDIRACSLVLFVMGERAPWVKKYRDAFEVLVNATMEKLENGVNNLAETAAVQMRNVSNNNTDFATEQFDNLAEGEDGDAWKVVAELANWIDQPEGSLVWMPDFELLQNLSPV
ncbi:fungal-specific transcription factor domain-containing protein [Nemania abortiva]|nr:fungal-specific transcription factor domain-containing protein [Nemania abortiva]